jgi:predicted lipid-binding transport protein (Tim44 family)
MKAGDRDAIREIFAARKAAESGNLSSSAGSVPSSPSSESHAEDPAGKARSDLQAMRALAASLQARASNEPSDELQELVTQAMVKLDAVDLTGLGAAEAADLRDERKDIIRQLDGISREPHRAPGGERRA